MISYLEIGDEIDLEDESCVILYHNPIDVKSIIMLSILQEIEKECPKINFLIIQDYDFKQYKIHDIPTVIISCCGASVFKASGVVPKEVFMQKLQPILAMV